MNTVNLLVALNQEIMRDADAVLGDVEMQAGDLWKDAGW